MPFDIYACRRKCGLTEAFSSVHHKEDATGDKTGSTVGERHHVEMPFAWAKLSLGVLRLGLGF
jgi:hypothetical protein